MVQFVYLTVFLILYISAIFTPVNASVGDNLAFFQKCLTFCEHANCSSTAKLKLFLDKQPPHLKLLSWTCQDECKYLCQWSTINYLLDDIEIDLSEVPQFYGKWTFLRILGIQEPASAFFSLCNLITTYVAWTHYCRSIFQLAPPTSNWLTSILKCDSDFFVVSLNALLGMNAWIWSVVFHIHDTPLTEKMDYFSAFSVVLFSFYAVVVRLVNEQIGNSSNRYTTNSLLLIPFLSYYLYHVYYLLYVYFDYAFNMKANLVAGFSASLLWLFWAYKRLHKLPLKEIKHRYELKCILCILLVNGLLMLELNDFPPIYFVFDAHSLWHLGTIIVPYLWFNFLADEAANNYKRSKFE